MSSITDAASSNHRFCHRADARVIWRCLGAPVDAGREVGAVAVVEART